MSYKDDLESLGYMIVGMLNGQMPWKDLMMEQVDKVQAELIRMRNPNFLCKGMEGRVLH